MLRHSCGPIRSRLSRAKSAYSDTILSIKTNEELLRTNPPNAASIKVRLTELYKLCDQQKMEMDQLEYELNACEAENDRDREDEG